MASEVKWFKFMNDMFDDDKIQYLESLPDGDTILIIWVKLLCLASKTNDDGSLKIADELPYTTSLLANKFKKTPMQIEYALNVMQKLGMICIIDEIIYVSNWAKYQSVDELAKIREQTRLRVQRCREKKKEIECNATVALNCNDFALISNSNNNIYLDNNKKEEKKKKEFIPPTLEEVKEYAKEKNYPYLANKFYDYFTTGNWIDSKGQKVKNWKQKFITWATYNTQGMKSGRSYSDEELNSMVQNIDEVEL